MFQMLFIALTVYQNIVKKTNTTLAEQWSKSGVHSFEKRPRSTGESERQNQEFVLPSVSLKGGFELLQDFRRIW